VLIDPLMVMNGIFQILQLRGKVYLTAGFAPRVHVAHVLGG
jgi:hypothetical protein